MFNVRVYGFLINDKQQILMSDELIRGKYYTKFPGGGLELGEGTRDCLCREFMEEMNLKVEVTDHFYTTDYFQPSVFSNQEQVISIYYFVKALEPLSFIPKTEKFDFSEAQMAVYEKNNSVETFRFMNLSELSAEEVSLPIDKIAATLLRQWFEAA